jgi:hypothetical protein
VRPTIAYGAWALLGAALVDWVPGVWGGAVAALAWCLVGVAVVDRG